MAPEVRLSGPENEPLGIVSLQEALLLLRARAYAEQCLIGELALDVLNGVVDFSDDLDGQ